MGRRPVDDCRVCNSAHRSEGYHIKAAQKGVPVMTREQKIVVIGSASGVVTMIAAVVGIYQIWPDNPSLGALQCAISILPISASRRKADK